ncbi:MAG: shikimate kinase [Chlamydiales bacterium]
MILSGLFCAGKTTLGRLLAQQMRLPFYDSDSMMEVVYRKPIRLLWLEHGETVFRHLEHQLVMSLKKKPAIIATGGGTLLFEQNYMHLKKLGEIVYLRTSISTLWERIQRRGLPAYVDAINPQTQIEELIKERIPILERRCDLIFDTEDLSPNDCIERLIKIFHTKY